MIGLTQQPRWPARLVAAAAFAFVMPLGAQNNAATTSGWNPQQVLRTETYVKPPADVERIIMAPRVDISFTTPSPDRRWFLRTPGLDRGDIEEYGKPHIYLGGVQIDTKANRARSLTTSTHTGITLIDPRTQATKTIETPKGASISAQTWSPSGSQVAYIANFDDASHIFVGDVASGKSVQVTKTPLLATLVTGIDWTPDGKSILAVLGSRGTRPRTDAWKERHRRRTGRSTHRVARDSAGHSSEPARGSARQGDAQVLHDRPARADRRQERKRRVSSASRR